MRGNFLVAIGIVLIGAGAVLLFIGYTSTDAAWAAVAWAAIIGGVIALLAGISRKVASFMDQRPNDNADYAHAEIRTLIQSMGEMAAADGVIHPREVETIADIHQRMLGITISHDEVSEILTEFHHDDNVHEKLQADRKMVNPAMKRMIIQSCYLVMISDGDEANTELTRLHEIGDALGIAKNEVEHLVSLAAG